MNHRLLPALRACLALCILGGLLLAGFPARAQVVDSLARLLASAAPDTHRVTLLTDYAWEINEARTDEAEARLREATALAQRLGFSKGEAAAWNGLGVVEEIRGNFAAAEQHYRKALELRRTLGDKRDIAASLNNLGVLYEMTGRFDDALRLHRENLDIQQELRDTVRMARAWFNIASAYQEMGLYSDALGYLNEARLVLEARQDPDGMAKAYAQMGHIQLELGRYPEARDWYLRELRLREHLQDPARLAEALSDYANALDELDSSQVALGYYLRALDIRKQLDDQPGQANIFLNLGDAHKHLKNFSQALDYLRQAERIYRQTKDELSLMEVYNTMGDVFCRAGQQQKSLEMVRKYYQIAQEAGDKKYIQGAYKDFAEVYAALGDYKKAYDYRVQYDEYRYQNLNEKMSAEYAKKEALFEDQKKREQIKKQELEIQRQQLQEARLAKQFYAVLAGAAVLLLLAAFLFYRNFLRARTNRELAAKNAVIERERQRADALLTNILPTATAAELKASNRVEPKRYESVTVLFTDFKGFTKIAEQVSFETLIAELDECFRLFDQIVEQYGLEKIKTIGDAYMCAGGLPTPNDSHPVDAVRAAIDMQRRLQDLMRQKAAEGKPVFEMRIGIHTGPVVAGVVGSHKFAYDIWGDTVNTAARLEEGSEPHKINISETTYQYVKDLFPCTYRGHLSAKNKGEIAMYFAEY